MKKLMIIFILVLSIVACSSDGSKADADNKQLSDNYVFDYNGTVIAIDDEAKGIIEQLGEPMEYFEAPSCAYQGMDKTYYYNGFEITTYTDEDIDYIANIVLVDDTVTTREGIYIGSSLDDIINAYGRNFEESTGLYAYIKDGVKLQFIIKDDVVESIMYAKII